jgi:hypothetical protein
MKKIMILLAIFTIFVLGVTVAIASNNGTGPAPNSGDCIPDGSGFDSPNGSGNGPGPAPNSGDGIPDGPGWE